MARSSRPASTAGRRKNQAYLTQRKEIAPYVSKTLLNKLPLKRATEAQKRLAREYHRALRGYQDEQGLLSKVVHVVRQKDTPKKSKAQLRNLQRKLGQPDLPYLNAAFVEVDYNKKGKPTKPKIKFLKGERIQIVKHGVSFETAEFDPMTILSDDDAKVRRHIAAQLAKLPTGKGITYHVQAGTYIIQDGLVRSEVVDDVMAKRRKYSNEKSTHHYSRWLFGITAQKSGKQMDKHRLRELELESRKERRRLLKAAKKPKTRK